MAQEAQEAPFCRICWAEEPPRGLADVLLDQPCGCRGYMARVHLSCLHSWQLQQLSAQPLADTATCGVCRQPYNVPEQLWEALAAAGGIEGDKQGRVQQQQQLQQHDPGQLRLLTLQQQAAQLRQDLQQAGPQLPTERLRRAVQQRLVAVEQSLRAADELQPALLQEPEQLQQLQQLRQELQQLRQAYRSFLGADRDGWKALEAAEGLHELRAHFHWLIQSGSWLSHALSLFADNSLLPLAEPPRPPLRRRLLLDSCITAWVLLTMARGERQRLGSWRAVWQRGYAAQHLCWVAVFGFLAAIAAAAGRVDPGYAAAEAPSHQPLLAAAADILLPSSLFLTCMSLSYWPSLVHLGLLPLRLFCTYWGPQFLARWPAMPALEGTKLVKSLCVQFWDDRSRAALATRCWALLQQRPQALLRFANALKPISPDVLPPSLFARLCSTLSRFLPFLAPSL